MRYSTAAPVPPCTHVAVEPADQVRFAVPELPEPDVARRGKPRPIPRRFN
jgi:hypothetical protein